MNGCRRQLPKGERGWICKRCWSAVPTGYKLALEDHNKLAGHPWPLLFEGEDMDPPRVQDWKPFLAASWSTLLAYLQANIWRWIYLREDDPVGWETAD